MNSNGWHEDFGDAPEIEERMDPFYSDEGQELLLALRAEDLPPLIAYVPDIPGFSDFLTTMGR
jgi:hypothetical protein